MSPLSSCAVQPIVLLLRLAGMLLMTRTTVITFESTGLMSRPVNSLVGLPLIVNVILVIRVCIPINGAVADIPNVPFSYNGAAAPNKTSAVKRKSESGQGIIYPV